MPVSLVPSQQRSARRQELPQHAPRSRTLLWSVYGLLGLLLLVYCITLIVRSAGSYSPWLDGFLVCSVELVACALCFARALTYRPGRAVALALGVSLLSWTVGDIVLNIESLGGVTPRRLRSRTSSTWASTPSATSRSMLFMRRELRRHAAPNWLDGVIAGVGAAAVCAAFAFHTILVSTGGNPTGDDDEPRLPDRGPAAARPRRWRHGDALRKAEERPGSCLRRASA